MMEEIVVRTVAYGTEEYDRMLELRDRLLRRPLGMRIEDDDKSTEPCDAHIAAFCADRVVGTVVLTPLAEGVVKMRQVAVDPAYQRRGIGRKMDGLAREWSLEQGYSRIVLHARKSAVAFYLSLGYRVEGEEFLEVGIPHRAMALELAGKSGA